MNARKKTILHFVLAITAILTFAFAGVFGISAKNTVVADAATQDFYTEGASVRDSEPTGIRFETKIKKSLYDEISVKPDVKFGTLIIPKALLGENELTAETPQVADATVKNWAADDGDYKKFNGVLTGGENGETYYNFEEKYYNVPLAARAYYSYTEGETTKYVYADSVERSVAEVASVAISKGDSGEFISGVLNSVFDKVKPTSLTADALVAGSDREIKISGLENLTPVWEVTGNGVAVENGRISASSAGTATVTAKLGDRSVSSTITVYENVASFVENSGYAIKNTTATCSVSGETVFVKTGFSDYTVTGTLGHSMHDYSAENVSGEKCSRCEYAVLNITAETDVPTGYNFAALAAGKTIASVTEGEQTIEGETVSFVKEDAVALTKNAKGLATGGNQAVKTYTVNYQDGSVYTVNLTIWSLFIDSAEDLLNMPAYAVQKNWSVYSDTEDSAVKAKRTFGYYKMTDNVVLAAAQNADVYKKTNAPDYYEDAYDEKGNPANNSIFARCGFWGTFDGNGKTIENFETSGNNHCGFINILGEGGIVKNVTFKNVYYKMGGYSTGIVAGYANGGTIENVTINGVKLLNNPDLASGRGVSLLVGSVGSDAVVRNAKNYSSWFTGLNVKNVAIDVIGENSFGTAIAKYFFHAFGEANFSDSRNVYSGFNDPEWIALRESQGVMAFPLDCENVTVSGISTLYGVAVKTGADYMTYASIKGVNGATETALAAA